MNPLEQRIKYKFRNSLLLAEALTHPSLGHETQRHHFDNQRLEFLGDAVLQLIFTEYLFDQFPSLSEGQLTKIRARIVSREGLRVLAERIGVGKYLMMGRGEESSGGRERASTLSDAFEALIGAMYLDSDFVTVRRIVLTESRDLLEDLEVDPPDTNPKGRLQELLQAISPISPTYPIVDQSGPEHQKRFVAKIVWDGKELGSGDGRSKKEAETAAARDALSKELWRGRDGNGKAAQGNAEDAQSKSE
ncbi:RNAse III [Chthoniobacter flavus]|nr:ribonuclease III [Chthoniobacter flavus]TCO88663.1 RNAse III [Chthoniobacter flavus]